MNRKKLRSRIGSVALVAALLGTLALAAVALAGADKPITVRAGNLVLTFNGGFSPKTLPKKTFAPISLRAEGNLKTVDGTHPPALKAFEVETDKNGTIDVTGFPVCRSSQLQSQDTAHAEAACKDAIIGKGTTTVEAAFPEQAPILVDSKLLVLNGGTKGGVTTLFIHAYFTAPITGAIVTTVKVKKIHKGRYGYLSTAAVPKIAGGNGSVVSFSLAINKKYTYKGKKMSILSAKCPDGKLQAHGTGVFSDGTRVAAEVVRGCTGKG